MVKVKKQCIKRKFLFSIVTLILMMSNLCTIAQEMPPRPIGISLVQNLNFGAFYQGISGGTINLLPNGIRYATGDIILLGLGYPYFPVIFGMEGNPGTIVHFLAGPDVVLTGSNGGSLILQIGDSDPGDPIIINVAPPNTMQINVGGTLTVGNSISNPPGYYLGSFSVMFIQE
jgi:hypothetical protein